MKRLSLFLPALLALALFACKGKKAEKAKAAQEVKEVSGAIAYALDLKTVKLVWRGYKVMKSDAFSHWGTLQLRSGSFDFKDGKLVGANLVIDMISMNAEDLKDDPKAKAKLETHLKSAGFFDTAEYPTAQFTLTHAEPQGDQLAVSGNLTMKGVTRNITFLARVEKMGDNKVYFTTQPFEINRRHWNVSFSHPAKEVVVKNDIQIQLSAQAIRE